MGIYCRLYTLGDNDIEAAVSDPDSLDSLLRDKSPSNHSVDQAWNGIHFLLTGEAFEGPQPLCFLLSGGKTIQESEDTHPTRAITSEQVSELDVALSGITEEEFRSRYNPDRMRAEDVWLFIGERDSRSDDLLDYLALHFVQLKSFVHGAAEQELGIIVGYC